MTNKYLVSVLAIQQRVNSHFLLCSHCRRPTAHFKLLEKNLFKILDSLNFFSVLEWAFANC